MNRVLTDAIDENEYIGDSLVKINTNFETLDVKYQTLISLLTSADTSSLSALQTTFINLTSVFNV